MVLKGLTHAWELGNHHVMCYVDCLEVQEVLTSSGDVQSYWHPEEILSARAMLARDWSVSVFHLPMEMNMVVDALAKIAVSESWDLKVWKLPPSTVVPYFIRI